VTGLLVSVRDGDEAQAAIRGGADLIDVKEPDRGSLGAADPLAWEEIARVVDDCLPLSVALGEILDAETPARVNCVKQVASIRFAKVGLAGCLDRDDWQDRWMCAHESLPTSVQHVAVAYADWMNARSPEPHTILSSAAQRGCRVLLLDTFDKRSGQLFDYMNLVELNEFACEARACDVKLVLGGSLSLETSRVAMTCKPAYIAVRSAVCIGSRKGRVDELLVRRLAQAINEQSKVPNA